VKEAAAMKRPWSDDRRVSASDELGEKGLRLLAVLDAAKAQYCRSVNPNPAMASTRSAWTPSLAGQFRRRRHMFQLGTKVHINGRGLTVDHGVGRMDLRRELAAAETALKRTARENVTRRRRRG
jgi:hypothetical protein